MKKVLIFALLWEGKRDLLESTKNGFYFYSTEIWLTSLAPTNEESAWLNEEKTLIE
jgi:hypothetical protein